MPFAKSINSNTYIRHLPISAYKELESLLDPGDMWEQFMENIPQFLDDSNSPLRYTAQDGLNIRTRSHLKGRSPTAMLLDDWSTQNPQIRHLIQALKESELYSAADYLSTKVLKGSAVQRIGQSAFSTPCTEASPDHRNLTSDSCNNYPPKSSGGKPEEHNELSPSLKYKNGNQLTQPIKPCTSITESLSSGGKDLKSFTIVESRPPAPRAPAPTAPVPTAATPVPVPIATATVTANQQKCQATENDETDQMKERFKKIDIGEIKQDNCPRIVYNILKEMTDDFNDKDFFHGGRLLGSGGFGSVYLGVKSDLQVAVKRLKDTTDEQTRLFETELKVLSKFQHENLVSLLGYSCGPKFCLVYTYMVNGSVEDRLKRKNNTPALTVDQRVHIAKGTAQGINYLNSNNVVHRDIKSANVLLDENFVPKVGDFATARTGPADMTSVFTMVVTGTAAYLAPEAYQHDVSIKLDSYSYGVVLLELLTALPVVDPERDERDLKSHIAEHCDDAGDIHNYLDSSGGSWPKHLVEEIYGIAMKCLTDRKRRRVTIADILPEIQKLSLINSCSATSSFC